MAPGELGWRAKCFTDVALWVLQVSIIVPVS